MKQDEKEVLKKVAEKIGKTIRDERLSEKMTQKELGDAIGISPSLISLIESGNRLPTIEQLIALGEYFFLSYDALLGTEHENIQKDYIEITGLSKRDIEIIEAMIVVMRSKEDRKALLRKKRENTIF